MIRTLKSCLQSRFFRGLVICLVALGFVLILLIFIFLFRFERKAFQFDIEVVGRVPKETIVIDATGTRVGTLHRAKGSDLPLESVSPVFLKALIAREDSRFWKHHGVDHFGIVRAQLRNMREKKFVQGASTITMQLSRMTFELREKSFERKLVEMAISRRIERRYSKKEILRFYVNRIFLGTGMIGIEQASRGYFGKAPSELNLPEAAMIAGIIRSPNGCSPFRQPGAAIREMQTTLDRMVDEGMITRKEAEIAKRARPVVLPQERWMTMLRKENQAYPRSWFLNMLEFKIAKLIPGSDLYGGFTIRTTIDHRLQKSADSAVKRWLAGVERVPGYHHPVYPTLDKEGTPLYLQGAGVVLENKSGAIRALVGGRDFRQSEFNRAIHTNRQVGSVIKPIIYAAAFETGMFPGSLVSDDPIRPGEFKWGNKNADWSPTNADGVHSGLKPASVGLIQSRNTMTVRVGESIGIDHVQRVLNFAGLADGRVPHDPQIYLGNLSASLLSLTSAYTAFPNQGIRHKPFLIESIHDREGELVYQRKPQNYRLFSAGAAWMTNSILQRVVEQGGSGGKLRQWGFDEPAGGKTGTTDDFVDAWFVGFTSRLTGGFWVGLDTPEPILKGAYGGRVAMPVWKETMEAAANIGYDFKGFSSPSEIFPVRLCRNTGLLASPACEGAGCAYTEKVPSSMIPRKFCKREE